MQFSYSTYQIKQALWQICVILILAVIFGLVSNTVRKQHLRLIGDWSTEGRLTTDSGDTFAIPFSKAVTAFDQKTAVFIDARGDDLFEQGHIKGARNFPWHDIDLVIHLQGVDFKDAVAWLYDTFSCAPAQSVPNQLYTPKQILRLPPKNDKKLHPVIHYLREVRCIPQRFISNLIKSGKFYADFRGNAVFLLLGKKKRIVGAELRGTCNTKWRGMAPGSRKKSGCFYIVGQSSKKMVLCESAIDAASCAVLHPEYTAISTSGAMADPAWLYNFLRNGCEIYCGFDTDRTGETMVTKMIKQYPSIKRLRPAGHDWNEVLQQNSHL